jgi:hypothetical protein
MYAERGLARAYLTFNVALDGLVQHLERKFEVKV